MVRRSAASRIMSLQVGPLPPALGDVAEAQAQPAPVEPRIELCVPGRAARGSAAGELDLPVAEHPRRLAVQEEAEHERAEADRVHLELESPADAVERVRSAGVEDDEVERPAVWALDSLHEAFHRHPLPDVFEGRLQAKTALCEVEGEGDADAGRDQQGIDLPRGLASLTSPGFGRWLAERRRRLEVPRAPLLCQVDVGAEDRRETAVGEQSRAPRHGQKRGAHELERAAHGRLGEAPVAGEPRIGSFRGAQAVLKRPLGPLDQDVARDGEGWDPAVDLAARLLLAPGGAGRPQHEQCRRAPREPSMPTSEAHRGLAMREVAISPHSSSGSVLIRPLTLEPTDGEYSLLPCLGILDLRGDLDAPLG